MPGKLPKQASLSSSSSSPDQRIKLLIDYGSLVEVDKNLAIKLYLRSGREMLRMANMYCDDGHFESAFILYYKFITLFVEKLREHPDYRSAPPSELSDFKRKVKKVFPIAEEIKLKLKDRYAEEEKIFCQEQMRLAEERAAEEEARRAALEQQEREDKELAKRLQEEEEEEVRSEQDRKYLQLREKEEERLREEEEKKRNQNVPAAAGVAAFGGAAAAAAAAAATAASGSSTLPASQGLDGGHPAISFPAAADGSALPPPPSYSQYLNAIAQERPQVPDRSLKKNLGKQEPSAPAPEPPSIDRTSKPSIDHHMSLGQFGGQAHGQLRSVVVPAALMSQFLTAAESNTLKESETMGILCGKMSQGCFSITSLFIPQQRGGHDSCDMENEEELIFYQDEHNLITLGWIHTHPTQTAFLSSVDLHSHFPWQKMMPEAIAIVCSPKFQETGIFKLTDHGLDVIGSCREKGFHPHNKNPPLFEDCMHVQVTETGGVILEDRRK
ncbi:stam-binding protein [Plakobranchus ocellatus]|uniref:Stam-binding protein n=1 Tax=Plakobranchus ocellatus TaxID=259542 RepID=A0AAV4A0B3_9GAST|nr:stam-binding protein [Plakobranchus ocellatus]